MTPDGGDDLLFDHHELACLAAVTGLTGLLGLDGGSGFVRDWADPAEGRTSLTARGWLLPAAEGDPADRRHEQVREPLRTYLAALFAGPARFGLSAAAGPVRTAVLVSFLPGRVVAALPEPGGTPVRVRFAHVAPGDVLRLVEAAFGGAPDAAPDAAVAVPGPERALPQAGLLGLGPRLLLRPDVEPPLVLADLRGWGLTADEADGLLEYLQEGGRTVTAHALTQVEGGTVLEEQTWFGRGDRWWSAEEGSGDVALRSASSATALMSVLELAARVERTVA